MERVFAKHRIKPRIIMEIPSNETIKQAVMAGMGLSFLSLRTARQEIAEVAAEPVPRHDAQHGKVLEMRRHRVRGNQPASLPQRA